MPLHYLFAAFEVILSHQSTFIQLPAFIIFLHQECETNLSFSHLQLQDFLNIL